MIIKTNFLALIALLLSATLWLMLLVHHLLQGSYYGNLITSIAIIVFQIVVPIEVLKYFKIMPKSFNIYAQNLETIFDSFFPPYDKRRLHPDYRGVFFDFLSFLKISLIVLPFYIIGYGLFFKGQAIDLGLEIYFSFNLPPQFFYEILTQIFVIALPEELFYRGFLQSALLQKWPNERFAFGLPVGKAIIITNLIFAFGHVIGSWSPFRLLTFFPGVLFSYLVYKNKSLLPAVLFHAFCNIVGQILYRSLLFK